MAEKPAADANVLDLSKLPENSRVHISIDNRDPAAQAQMPVRAFPVEEHRQRKEVSSKGFMGLVGGSIGAVVGWIGGKSYASSKITEFERDVAIETAKRVTNSLAGATAETGSGALNGLGRGMADHTIREGVVSELSKDTAKYGRLPNFMYKYLRHFPGGGVGAAATAGAVVIGGAAAVTAYALSSDTKEKAPEGAPEGGKDWSNRVQASEAQPRVPGK